MYGVCRWPGWKWILLEKTGPGFFKFITLFVGKLAESLINMVGYLFNSSHDIFVLVFYKHIMVMYNKKKHTFNLAGGVLRNVKIFTTYM